MPKTAWDAEPRAGRQDVVLFVRDELRSQYAGVLPTSTGPSGRPTDGTLTRDVCHRPPADPGGVHNRNRPGRGGPIGGREPGGGARTAQPMGVHARLRVRRAGGSGDVRGRPGYSQRTTTHDSTTPETRTRRPKWESASGSDGRPASRETPWRTTCDLPGLVPAAGAVDRGAMWTLKPEERGSWRQRLSFRFFAYSCASFSSSPRVPHRRRVPSQLLM